MRDPNLRLDDLVSRGKRGSESTRLMNVKVPANVLGRIDKVASSLGATKTEVVIAILNEGLDSAEHELKDWTPAPKVSVPSERQCSTGGCERERVARGLCAAHYQAQRRAQS
jgi:hypothetical protein